MNKPSINLSTILPSKKMTDEELAGHVFLPFGKKHPIRILIESLEPGEKCNVSRLDFQWGRHNPNYFCNQISKSSKRKFSIFKNRNRSGWLVVREA